MNKILYFLFFILTAGLISPVSATEKKHELTPEVMMDTGDAMRSLTLGAFQYSYHLNHDIWIGVDSFVGKAVVDSGSGLTVKNGDTMWGVDPVIYFNVPALLGATKEKPEGAQAQIYTSLGVGYLQVGPEKTVYGVFGGGLLWESGLPWLGLRFDLKGLFYMLDNTSGSKFNSDLALSIGPSFLF